MPTPTMLFITIALVKKIEVFYPFLVQIDDVIDYIKLFSIASSPLLYCYDTP